MKNLFTAWQGLVLTLLLLTCTAPATAQTENAADTLPPPPGLRLLARPYGDSITLRWAPTDFTVWREMRTNGVVLERRIAGADTWQSVTTDRLIAYTLEDFTTFTNTDNVHVVAVAEALHGDAEYPATPPAGPMGEVRLKLDEQDQRFFLAAVNADLSAQAATALGWRWTDRGLRPGIPYEYRVRTVPGKDQVGSRYTSEPLRVRSSDNFAFGPVSGLSIREGDQKITLEWPVNPNRKRYVAYHVEVSDDGRNFRRTQEYPLFKTLPQDGETDFKYEVKLDDNYVRRHYRLVGINSFGELAEASLAVAGQGIDLTPPPSLNSLKATDNGSGGFRLTWEFPEATPPDVRGYVVVRSWDYKGPFSPVNDRVLPPLATEFTDPEPTPYRANYYAVYTYDTAGNYAMSTPAIALWHDEEPPAKPTGLTGKIDTLGNVFLVWEPGQEPDLHGYRVYMSHAKKREFLQVTTEILHQNYYFDSTRLRVLNEKIYYQVVALDNNFNPSAYSDILELERPDVIAPSAPVITDFAARGSSVTLRWRPSSSPDVVHQEIWRSGPDAAARPIRALGGSDTLFVDTSTVARTPYVYFIRVSDEANLFADSRSVHIVSGTSTKLEGVSQWARTQVPGTDEEAMTWQALGRGIGGFQLYYQAPGEALKPYRQLAPELRSWPIPAPERDASFAIQIIYQDGGRSALSTLAGPTKR